MNTHCYIIGSYFMIELRQNAYFIIYLSSPIYHYQHIKTHQSLSIITYLS